MSEELRFYDLGNSASGSWYVIHLLAANGEISALKGVLKTFSKRFVCPKCRFHIRDYLKTFPFDERKPFEWTVTFHNAVNVRLGKPTLTDEERNDLLAELTEKADEDELKILQGGECEGCTTKPSSSSLKETFDKTRVRRSASFPQEKKESWPINLQVTYI